MRSLVIALSLALAAGPATAQIFPDLEREQVLKRATSGPKAPTPDSPVKGAGVDGAAVLKRYDELLEGYRTGKGDQLKAVERVTAKCHESVRRYQEGLAALRLGYYDAAERSFASVGATVTAKNDAEARKIPALKAVVNEIKSGKAFYWQMVAAVGQRYRDFKDADELVDTWDKARKDGESLQKAVDRKVDDPEAGKATKRAMEGWLIKPGRRGWEELWAAEREARSNPADIEKWVRLLFVLDARTNVSADEMSPVGLKRRAVALLIKQFWPECETVKEGTADLVAAFSHVAAFQFEEYSQYLTPQDYHTASAKAALGEFGERAKKDFEVFQKLRNN